MKTIVDLCIQLLSQTELVERSYSCLKKNKTRGAMSKGVTGRQGGQGAGLQPVTQEQTPLCSVHPSSAMGHCGNSPHTPARKVSAPQPHLITHRDTTHSLIYQRRTPRTMLNHQPGCPSFPRTALEVYTILRNKPGHWHCAASISVFGWWTLERC